MLIVDHYFEVHQKSCVHSHSILQLRNCITFMSDHHGGELQLDDYRNRLN